MKTKLLNNIRPSHLVSSSAAIAMAAALIAATSGCHSARKSAENQNKGFFTSGSSEADQRASQRMAQSEQLAGTGGAGGEGSASSEKGSEGGKGSGQAEAKLSLFQRLGGEQGITAIVNDWLPRAMQDPRVNWDRKGVTKGGIGFTSGHSEAWNPTAQNVQTLKTHLIQFFSLATGGPAHYQGRSMGEAHKDMHISNPEFDAAVGDLKVSLDALKVPNTEQKELLAIVESTRPEIVTKR